MISFTLPSTTLQRYKKSVRPPNIFATFFTKKYTKGTVPTVYFGRGFLFGNKGMLLPNKGMFFDLPSP